MAVISDMGVLGNGIYHPQVKHKFRINFINFGGDGEPLKVQCITAERPKLEKDEITLDRYNSRAYIAGKHMFDPINIGLEVDIGGKVATAIRAQQEREQRIIGLGSAPTLPSATSGQDYKFTIELEQMTGNADTVLETWVIQGCWLKRVDWGDNDYTVSEAIRVQMTVRFDHAYQVITGIVRNAHPNS